MQRKKRPFWIFIFLALVLSVILFRQPLLTGGVNLVLRTYLPHVPLNYQHAGWDNGQLVLREVSLEESGCHAHILEARIKWNPTLFPFKLEPHLTLIDPEIILTQDNQASLLPAYQFKNLTLDIPSGRLLCGEEDLYFRFKSADSLQQMGGSLVLSYDATFTSDPLLSVEVVKEGELFIANFIVGEIECANLVQLISSFYPQLREGWEHLEGTVALKGKSAFTLPFSLDQLDADIDMQHLSIANSKFKFQADVEHFQGNVSFPVLPTLQAQSETFRPFWRQIMAAMQIESGKVSFENYGLFAQTAQLNLDPNLDPFIHVRGSVFHGGQEYPLDLEGKGSIHEDRSFWLELSAKLQQDEEVFVSLCSPENGMVVLQGDFKNIPFLQWEPFQHFADLSFTGGTLSGSGSGLLKQGKWELSFLDASLQQAKYLGLEGDLHIAFKEGFFSPSHFKGTLQGIPAELNFQGPPLGISGTAALFCPYDHLLKLVTDVPEGFESRPLFITTAFKQQGKNWEADGKVVWDNAEALTFNYQWKEFFLTQGEARFQSKKFPKEMASFLPFEGDLSFEGKAKFDGSKVQAQISSAAVQMTPQTAISGLVCHLNYDPKVQELSLGHGSARLHIKDQTLPVMIEKVSVTPHQTHFDLSLFNEENEMARAVGACNEHKEFSFEPATHFFGIKPATLQIQFDQTALTDFHFHGQIEGKKLQEPLAFLNALHLVTLPSLDFLDTASIESQVHYREGKWRFALEEKTNGISLEGEKAGAQWNIEKLSLCGLLVSGKCLLDDAGITASSFKIAGDSISAEGSLRLNFAKDLLPWSVFGKATVAGQTPFGEFSSEKDVPFVYSPTQGLIVEKAKMSMGSLGQFEIYNLAYQLPEKKGSIAKMHFQLAANAFPQIPQEIKGTARVEFQNENYGIEGVIGDQQLSLLNQKFDLNEIGFSLDSKIANFHAKTSYQNEPLALSFGVDFSKERLSLLKIQDGAQTQEGIKITFKGADLTCDTIQGALFGLQPHFVKKAGRLTGTLNADGRQFAKFLPKDLSRLQLGKGYQLAGDLSLDAGLSFKGKLTGKSFELLGYHFDDLEAALDVAKDRMKISDFHLGDVSGELSAPQVKSLYAGSWLFEIPLVQIRDFQPSRMRLVHGTQKPIKPFIITHASLSDLQGDLANFSTLIGEGTINFANQENKKAAHFLDFPIEMVKDLGLDPDLFTPICGEIACKLKGNKLFLTGLKNSYSEGQRSHFFLATEEGPSFLSLDGGIHVDLKLRQDVMLKLAEPLTLKLRGTLQKPRYEFSPHI